MSDHNYSFEGKVQTDSRVYEAWKAAMDIRKFEIELYWKRATYFWTFIGLTLGGYVAVVTANPNTIAPSARSDALFTLACIGQVFALAWYFVNRGSKFWQRNWEYQVDVLERQAIGPLYSTVFAGAHDRFSKLTGAYPFSVSNINHLLSLFIVGLFVLLAVYAMPCYGITTTCGVSGPKLVVALFSLGSSFALYYWGRTTTMRRQGAHDPSEVMSAPVEIRFSVRNVSVTR